MRSTLFALFLIPCTLAAQSPEIDKLVRARMEATKTPGVTIAIVRDGKVEVKGYGFVDIENQIPAKAETVYEIGSVTKQFTATAVMMLVEQGKVKLDEPALTYLPDLPAEWKGVTVRHLLTHTSGIKSYTGIPTFGTLATSKTTHSQLVKLVASQKPDFEPGARWAYNNSGYYLLGMLIEKVSQKTYRDALKEMIFAPLGMDRTDFFLPNELVPNRAHGYDLVSGKVQNAEYIDMSWPFAAGALLSTAPDLAKWALAQGSAKLMKAESWQAMWTEAKLNDGKVVPYGFGWGLSRVPGSRVIEHNGAIPGFEAQISTFPDKKLAIIVLANCISSLPGPLIADIAGALDPTLKKEAPKAIADDDVELTKKLRKVFEDILAGKADPDAFSEELRKNLFPTNILTLKEQLNQLGALGSFELMATSKVGDVTRRAYLAKVGSLNVRVTYAVDEKGKIAGFLVRPG